MPSTSLHRALMAVQIAPRTSLRPIRPAISRVMSCDFTWLESARSSVRRASAFLESLDTAGYTGKVGLEFIPAGEPPQLASFSAAHDRSIGVTT